MDNPGIKDLGSRTIGAPLTDEVITSLSDGQGNTREYFGDLEGMLAATIDINFVAGSGGTNCAVVIETSINQGTTWIEVYRALFTTSNGNRVVNLSALTPVTSPYAPAALSNDTVKDGILGDRLRSKVTSTGTYTGNASVSVRANVR